MPKVKRRAENAAISDWPDAFVGGAVCLDFINTVEAPGTPHFADRLSSYEMLLQWSLVRGTIQSNTAAKLGRLAGQRSHEAAGVWQEALDLREELYRLVSSIENSEDASAFIKSFNAKLTSLPPVCRLTGNGAGGFIHTLSGTDLREPLWPVLWSMANFLTSDHLPRLGHCHANPCRYVFIDLSRSKSRLWCSSSGCGNRERVRRAYVARPLATERANSRSLNSKN